MPDYIGLKPSGALNKLVSDCRSDELKSSFLSEIAVCDNYLNPEERKAQPVPVNPVSYPELKKVIPNAKGESANKMNNSVISPQNYSSASIITFRPNSTIQLPQNSLTQSESLHTGPKLSDSLFPSFSITESPKFKPGPVIAVIPAYKEEVSIGSVVVHTRNYVDTVIVVDDGSPDKTSLIARAAGADVITLPSNKGKATALMKGFARVRELDPAVVVMLDADGQHNPAEIPFLIKPILEGKADLVIGSRFLNNKNNIPAYRQFGQKTLNIATQLGSGFASTDSQSGFRAISRTGLEHLNFKSDGYNIESDMITHFLKDGLVITEVPINVRYDVPNKHKKNPVSHGMDILTHMVGLLGYKRPLLSFGIPGMIFIFIGLVLGFGAFTQYIASGRLSFLLPMMSMMFIIMGMLLVTSSFTLNSLVCLVKEEKEG